MVDRWKSSPKVTILGHHELTLKRPFYVSKTCLVTQEWILLKLGKGKNSEKKVKNDKKKWLSKMTVTCQSRDSHCNLIVSCQCQSMSLLKIFFIVNVSQCRWFWQVNVIFLTLSLSCRPLLISFIVKSFKLIQVVI